MPLPLIPIAVTLIWGIALIRLMNSINRDKLNEKQKEEFDYLKSEAEKGGNSKLSKSELRERLKKLL